MNIIATYHPQYNEIYLSIDNDRLLVLVSKYEILSNYNHPVVAKSGSNDQKRIDFDTGIKKRIYQMDGNGYKMKIQIFTAGSPKKAVEKAVNYFNFELAVSLKQLTEYQI